MFNGSWVFAHSVVIESKRVSGGGAPSLAVLGFYYKNNLFLGMFQLKFCLKTFETCSLLYIFLLKFNILEINCN